MVRPVFPKLGIFAIDDSIKIPEFATKDSLCFDLSFQASKEKNSYSGFNLNNKPINRFFSPSEKSILINQNDRILVPTGLHFDIPKGYGLKLYPRSGLSLTYGLVLANNVGIIDSDYVNEVFVILTNISSNGYLISSGERIAQAEFVKAISFHVNKLTTKPEIKTDRIGGFGSTGTKT